MSSVGLILLFGVSVVIPITFVGYVTYMIFTGKVHQGDNGDD